MVYSRPGWRSCNHIDEVLLLSECACVPINDDSRFWPWSGAHWLGLYYCKLSHTVLCDSQNLWWWSLHLAITGGGEAKSRVIGRGMEWPFWVLVVSLRGGYPVLFPIYIEGELLATGLSSHRYWTNYHWATSLAPMFALITIKIDTFSHLPSLLTLWEFPMHSSSAHLPVPPYPTLIPAACPPTHKRKWNKASKKTKAKQNPKPIL